MLAFLSACTPENEGQDIQFASQNESLLLPKEMWIGDALSWIESSRSTSNSMILLNSLPEYGKELQLFFNQNMHLYKTDILPAKNAATELFFESGRIIYALHGDSISGLEWLIAYANEKPYAAAKKEKNKWVSENPYELPINASLMSASIDQSKNVESSELKENHKARLKNEINLITDSITGKESKRYVLNMAKGDSVSIQINSEDKRVFFTVAPYDGIGMEERAWEGIADNTGDLAISIFASSNKTTSPFELRVVHQSK